MAEKNKKSNTFEEEVDPFDELNEFDEDFTSIETEKDFFDEIEQSDLEKVPQYDSTSGKIIEGSDAISQIEESDKIARSQNLFDAIDEVDINNSKDSKDKKDTKKTGDKKSKRGFVSRLLPKLSKDSDEPKSQKPAKRVKPKARKTQNTNETKKSVASNTKVIDNVKVDEDGVPLLNQFDTEKIKESSLFPKLTISKVSFSKIIMIAVGIIITITGILQAMNDVVKVSDHVMYGEHESIAFGLIFLGIIIIILAFYKEIMNAMGLNNLSNVMDDVDVSDSDKKSKK
ncbi:MAG TPA: hypothetical protein HA277_03020 [Methanosphaera sp.]|jgi:hypothetical protein|nr:hypothetical protein [Methanosphaera sp.]HIJ15354.1 hypothetical protein [Methanosphaera sp.]